MPSSAKALGQAGLNWAEAKFYSSFFLPPPPNQPKKCFQAERNYNLQFNNQDKHIFALGGLALLAKLVLSLAQLSPSLLLDFVTEKETFGQK